MTTQKAVWSTKEGRELKELPIPTPEAGEVLIKNVVIASNPKDWKFPHYVPNYASVEGNDIAGYVEAVGEGVSGFKKGDKVAAFTVMNTHQKYGAYQEYSISPDNSVFHLAESTSFEDAVTLPLAFMTAALGLFVELKLPSDENPDTSSPPTPVLVWGGATTVGVFVIQLAKRAGLHVVAVVGSSAAHAKEYGADETIDYRGKSTSELAAAIKATAGGKIRHIYDAIGDQGTLDVAIEALSPEGGAYTFVNHYSEEQRAKIPSNVTHSQTYVGTAHSKPSDAEFARKYYKKAGEWLEDGSFKPQKYEVVPGGLEGVDSGVQRLFDNKVTAAKLVYRIKETPGLA